MGLLSRLKEKAAAAVEAHLEAKFALIEAMPPETIWAGHAEWETRGVETNGLLYHDGRTVRFRSWSGKVDLTLSPSHLTHRRGEAKVDDGTHKGELDDVRHLRNAVPGYDLPACTDIEHLDGPMMGFFTTLGIPV